MSEPDYIYVVHGRATEVFEEFSEAVDDAYAQRYSDEGWLDHVEQVDRDGISTIRADVNDMITLRHETLRAAEEAARRDGPPLFTVRIDGRVVYWGDGAGARWWARRLARFGDRVKVVEDVHGRNPHDTLG